jgi:ubiquinone/menaquinone biosynthesis C-methylase UbiE
VQDRGSELFELQQTLYTSRNPTRRWLHNTRRDWIVSTIRRLVTHGGVAIEIGPGSGVYLPVLAEVCDEVVGADIEDAYLSRLRPLEQSVPGLRLVRDDITRSSFADNSFDVVLCTEVVEHIKDSRAALAEMRRILKPGGLLILSTPQRYSPLEVFSKMAFLPGVIDVVRRIYKEAIRDTEHINLMTRSVLRTQLRDAGFTLRERHTGGVYIPIVAEFLGDRALRFERAIEPRLRGSRLEWLLWTQYEIATVG